MTMIVEITRNLWEIIIAITAAVGLGLTVYQLRKNNQTLQANKEQQKESNRIRELQLVESTYQEIISTEERLFYAMLEKGDDKLDPHEWSFLFNRIEHLCFLFNHGFVRDKALLDYFRDAVIEWHDNWFVRYLPEKVVKDETILTSFRYRYNLNKKELEEEKRVKKDNEDNKKKE
jgi:hypothetical protein